MVSDSNAGGPAGKGAMEMRMPDFPGANDETQKDRKVAPEMGVC